jgi:hypothetical protein
MATGIQSNKTHAGDDCAQLAAPDLVPIMMSWLIISKQRIARFTLLIHLKTSSSARWCGSRVSAVRVSCFAHRSLRHDREPRIAPTGQESECRINQGFDTTPNQTERVYAKSEASATVFERRRDVGKIFVRSNAATVTGFLAPRKVKMPRRCADTAGPPAPQATNGAVPRYRRGSERRARD